MPSLYENNYRNGLTDYINPANLETTQQRKRKIIMRISILSTVFICSVALSTTQSNAQEAELTTETPTVTETVEQHPFQVQFDTICEAGRNNSITLSVTAMENCNENAIPSIIADGSRFSKRGSGAEFNTFMRNMSLIGVETASVETE